MSDKKEVINEKPSRSRSIVNVICTIMAVTLTFSLAVRFVNVDWTKEPADSKEPTIVEPVASFYNIEYKAVVNGEVKDIYPQMFKTGGSYPTKYIVGENFKLDDLDSWVPISSRTDWDFYGWYLDSACTIPFDGSLLDVTSDMTIYAKITEAHWTANY